MTIINRFIFVLNNCMCLLLEFTFVVSLGRPLWCGNLWFCFTRYGGKLLTKALRLGRYYLIISDVS